MTSPAETVSQMIAALAEEKSLPRRRTHANTAHVALRQLLEQTPPPDAREAEERGYRKGLLAAIDLLKEAREKHEAPLRAADVGHAYTVLNGVRNYGEFLCSDAENCMGREAFRMERLKKESES